MYAEDMLVRTSTGCDQEDASRHGSCFALAPRPVPFEGAYSTRSEGR
jgi:hypothetical protein